MRRTLSAVLAILVASAWCIGNASAQEPKNVEAPEPSLQMVLGTGQSDVLVFDQAVERVSVANEAVADVVAVSPKQILVNGKQPGVTSMVIWQSGTKHLYTLAVRPSLHRRGSLEELLRQIMPEEDQIAAYESDKTIILAGKAKHPASVTKAIQAATMVTQDKERVVNLVDVIDPKQVLIQVQIAEADRKLTRALGVDWITQSTQSTQSGFLSGLISPQTPASPQYGRVGDSTDLVLSDVAKYLFEYRGSMDLTVAIQALEEKGLVRILAQPNLLAQSGEEASFLAGGEFPIPIVQGSSTGSSTTIQFKEFGVKLKFKPEVMADDSIRLKVEPEVSVLDFGQAAVKLNGFEIPGLLIRKASTTVEIKPGQSLVLGGLLSQSQNITEDKVPFLGQIPILGKLFSSEKYRNEETELLVLVTPRLVHPEKMDFQKPMASPYPDALGSRLEESLGISNEKAYWDQEGVSEPIAQSNPEEEQHPVADETASEPEAAP